MTDHGQAAIRALQDEVYVQLNCQYGDFNTPSNEEVKAILAAAEPHLRRKWAAELWEKVNPPDAEHDREVAAKALIDAAQDIYLPSGGPSTYVDIDYAELLASLYLKGRAEQIKKGAGE